MVGVSQNHGYSKILQICSILPSRYGAPPSVDLRLRGMIPKNTTPPSTTRPIQLTTDVVHYYRSVVHFNPSGPTLLRRLTEE